MGGGWGHQMPFNQYSAAELQDAAQFYMDQANSHPLDAPQQRQRERRNGDERPSARERRESHGEGRREKRAGGGHSRRDSSGLPEALSNSSIGREQLDPCAPPHAPTPPRPLARRCARALVADMSHGVCLVVRRKLLGEYWKSDAPEAVKMVEQEVAAWLEALCTKVDTLVSKEERRARQIATRELERAAAAKRR